jgi:prevent-host-death family protein
MIQVTVEEFKANLHEYIENREFVRIVSKGERDLFLVPASEKDWFDEWMDKEGPFDFSKDSEVERFKEGRVMAKYESIN